MTASLRVLLALLVLVMSSACDKFRTGVDPDPLPVILDPGSIPTVVSFTGSTPGAGAEVRAGDQVSLSMMSTEFENGTLSYGLVLIRDDGQELPFTCQVTTGGGISRSSKGETIPAVDKFWVAGHTVNIALIAHFDTVKAKIDFNTPPPDCAFSVSDGQYPVPHFSVDWTKVQYRSDIALNWQVVK